MIYRAPVVLFVALSACGNASDQGTPSSTSAPKSVAPTSSAAVLASATPSAAGSQATTATPSAAARPLYFERAITEEDLAGRTLRELALMRNTIYARAGNSFRRPWLDTYFRAQSWYKPEPKIDESKISKLDKENARKIADHDAALTKEALEKMRDEVLARKKAGTPRPEDAVELSLLSQRLGTYVGGEEGEAEPSPLEDPSRLDKLLKVEELSTLSRRDLRILRNTVYARRGRHFDSKVVQSYFAGASWYRPRDDYHDGMLNEIDTKNIAIIRSVEDSLGGPLHENPDYGKDGWFVMA